MLVQFAQMASVAIENARLYSEAREAVRAREVLMSIVSHDLRNLLSAIIGSANLLKRVVPPPAEGEPPLTKNGLDRIDRAVARMNGIIGELLDFARVRAGQQLDLLLRRTDLVAVSRQVVAEYRQSTDRHRIEVTAALPELWGIWDASRIERVLDNLVSNAIKYSPKGGEITLEIVCEQAGGEEYAVLTVRDEGIGIPEADMPDVFGW